MRRSSNQVLKSQKLRFAMFTSGVMAAVGLASYLILADSTQAMPEHRAENQKIALPADKIDLQDVWISEVKTQSTLFDQRLSYLENLLLESKQRELSHEKESEDLRRQVHRLKQELQKAKQPEPLLASASEGPVDSPFAEAFSASVDPITGAPMLQEVVMPEVSRDRVSHVDQVIPAGTTVKALLVSSVDASCSVHSPNDPYPVKLRILDDGHLPRKVRAMMKGGLIIGSAYGNISSERVYIRLERLTQVKPTGDFVETEVAGFVSGEDGKYGVRGVVADRSDHLVKSAAVSGFFGGVSQFLQATINAQNIRDATDGLPNDLRYSMIREGGVSGASTALDKLSEYYIRRAEQLQPVIQVAAGRVVDITFTHGAEVGDLHTQDKVRSLRSGSA